MSVEFTSVVADPAEFENLIMQRAGWRHPDDYPESLYHYTSSTAFLSILTSGELWFTDFRYLNDLSELRYGIDLFTTELLTRELKGTDRRTVGLITRIKAALEETVVQTDQFVFCMCAENNLLNQWRVYGRDTVPVSIELATRGFMFVDWEPHYFDLVPMVYDESSQQRIADGVIDVGLEYATRHEQIIFKNDASLKSYVEHFATLALNWCATMKHPQFEVEKEWRLATTWGPGRRFKRGQKFRASPSGIIPYLTARPKADDPMSGGRLPVRSVTIGPCSHPQIQQRTLLELLYQHGMADVEVRLSNLPIRV